MLRLPFCSTRSLEGLGVRTMTGHTVVKTPATREKAFGLGVIFPIDQAHELVHHISMEPRRPECMLSHQPAWRKDRKINIGHSMHRRGSCKHSEDRRIRMVE